MGSSGLIYAAIVAAWAAVLVPRWVRRYEEVDQAREADQARGVRVLGSPASLSRGTRAHARHESVLVQSALSQPPATEGQAASHVGDAGRAAHRRRRVLTVLGVALAAVTVVAVIGLLPLWSVAGPALVLAGFLGLARRAAAAEQISRARRGRPTPAEPAVARTPRAVLAEPTPAEPVDPHLWEPVPVPLPTYLTKPKAPQPAARTIDLSHPGAWTSASEQPAEPVALPAPTVLPQPVEDDVEELPEHRRAVGD
jgi:hypothetical protein